MDSISCNIMGFTVLDMSVYSHLVVFEVGDYSLSYVKEVRLIGLKHLERVIIGNHCFRKNREKDPTSHFYLKSCERLRELKMGCWSFSNYSVCAIENLPSLEVIEMGEMKEESNNFYHASLELKGDYIRMK